MDGLKPEKRGLRLVPDQYVSLLVRKSDQAPGHGDDGLIVNIHRSKSGRFDFHHTYSCLRSLPGPKIGHGRQVNRAQNGGLAVLVLNPEIYFLPVDHGLGRGLDAQADLLALDFNDLNLDVVAYGNVSPIFRVRISKVFPPESPKPISNITHHASRIKRKAC